MMIQAFFVSHQLQSSTSFCPVVELLSAIFLSVVILFLFVLLAHCSLQFCPVEQDTLLHLCFSAGTSFDFCLLDSRHTFSHASVHFWRHTPSQRLHCQFGCVSASFTCVTQSIAISTCLQPHDLCFTNILN